MKIILCVDDKMGLSFNNRRQSRDKFLIDYLCNNLKDYSMVINNYSVNLFKNYINNKDYNITVISDEELENYLNNENVYYFSEKSIYFLKYKEQIDEIILCRWNRLYPSDLVCPNINDINSKFILKEKIEIIGNSHDNITIEYYKE